MALFKGKKNTPASPEATQDKSVKTEAPVVAKKEVVSTDRFIDNDRIARAIVRPRITEKATDLQIDNNVYTFDVHPDATKPEVAQAIKAMYGVNVVNVRMVQVPRKQVRSRRGYIGFKSGGKKAYVELKKGDTIEFV